MNKKKLAALLCAAFLLAGCAQPAAAIQPSPVPTTEPTPEPRMVLDEKDRADLDDFCDAQPGAFSVYLCDLDSGETYVYGEENHYYPASLLKMPYALWLCRRAENGELSLSEPLPNLFRGQEQETALELFQEKETISARAAIRAMISQSDNNATSILTSRWPTDETFTAFLADLGYDFPEINLLTADTGILGYCSVDEMGATMQALNDFFAEGSTSVLSLQSAFLNADHPGFYVPDGVEAARKYGSWDAAFHDAAIVYAEHPYILVCMTDQGSASVDFPPETVETMRQLGQMVWEMLEDESV